MSKVVQKQNKKQIKSRKSKAHCQKNGFSFSSCATKDQGISLCEYWLFYLTPILLWMFLIYLLSSLTLFTAGGGAFDLSAYILRKTAHVGEYFVLTLLIIRAVYVLRWSINQTLFISAAIAFLYALSDEWHQSFVPFRDGKCLDVGIDLVGIILGVLVYALWHNTSKNKAGKDF